jgi:hypothetical protein
MSPLNKEQATQLVIEALAALSEQPKHIRLEILESSNWLDDLTIIPSQKLNERLDDYFDWLNGNREENAGNLLEEIAYLLFESFIGVGNIRSFQTHAPQFDLVIDGESKSWTLLLDYLHLPRSGRSMVIECKNRKGKISDQQFSRLCGIIQNQFEDTSHLGVFISQSPATGFPVKGKKERALRDARATQVLFHAKTNKYVVVIDHDDLVEIRNGINFAKILEAKIREVEASAGIALEFNEGWQEVSLPSHLAKYRD